MRGFRIGRDHAVAMVVLAVFVAGLASWQHQASAAGSLVPVVYVATGENFPDALGGGPVAAMVQGPVLLVQQNAIPSETAAELARLLPDKIVIIGGTSAVSASVETALGGYATTVERIAGANRYDTAAKLSQATFPVMDTSPHAFFVILAEGDVVVLGARGGISIEIECDEFNVTDHQVKVMVDSSAVYYYDDSAQRPAGRNGEASFASPQEPSSFHIWSPSLGQAALLQGFFAPDSDAGDCVAVGQLSFANLP